MLRQLKVCALVASFALLVAQSALAQQKLPLPSLLAIYPAGAKAGSEIELTITSQSQLEGADRLLFSHAGITAKRLMRAADRYYPEATPVPDKFVVAIAADVPPGNYEVRAGGTFGITNARRFVVAALAEALEQEDNNEPERANEIQLGSVINGSAENSQVDYFRFAAPAGQTVVIDCRAERLDSRGECVLAVLDETGRELAQSRGAVGRDPLVVFTPPAAGTYLLRVHEVTYGNYNQAVPSPYRITLGTSPWIAFIDPPVAKRGSEGKFTLYGRNLGGQPSPLKAAGQPLEQLAVTIAAPRETVLDPEHVLNPVVQSIDFFSYRFQGAAGSSNPLLIALADETPTREREPNDTAEQPQLLDLPTDLVSHFDKPGDQDWYSIRAEKDDVVWIEIESQRLGMPTDPILVVQQVVERKSGDKEKGETVIIEYRDLAAIDDQPPPFNRLLGQVTIDDPAYKLVVPAAGTYLIGIRDQYASAPAGAAPFYRLRVRKPTPGFRLLALPGLSDPANNHLLAAGPHAVSVAPGGSEEVLVLAFRREGFDGPIDVSLDGLPPGLTCAKATIAPAEQSIPLVVRAAPDKDIAQPGAAAPIRVTGKAKIGEAEVTVPSLVMEQLYNVNNVHGWPARLADRMVATVAAELPVAGRFELAEQKPWRMARGGKLELPIRFVKQGAFQGQLNLGAVGLPASNLIRAPQTNLSEGNPTGKLTLEIEPNVAPGPLLIYARGEADVDFRPFVAVNEQARKDKERIDQEVRKVAGEFEQAQQNRRKSEQELQNAQQERSQVENRRNQAEQNARQATERARQRAEQTAQFKKQQAERAAQATELATKAAELAKDQTANDQAKQQVDTQAREAKQRADQAQAQLDEAAKQQAEADKQVTTAEAELAKLKQARDEVEKKVEAAAKTREERIAAEQAAQQEAQRSQQIQQQAITWVNRTNEVSRQNKWRVSVHSDPIPIEIVAYPMTLKLESSAITVAAGEPAELAVSAVREFDFGSEITFELRPPGGLGNFRFEDKNRIEAKQNAARLKLLTDKNAKPGDYEVELIVRMNFYGRGLDLREKLQVKITPALETKPAK